MHQVRSAYRNDRPGGLSHLKLATILGTWFGCGLADWALWPMTWWRAFTPRLCYSRQGGSIFIKIKYAHSEVVRRKAPDFSSHTRRRYRRRRAADSREGLCQIRAA